MYTIIVFININCKCIFVPRNNLLSVKNKFRYGIENMSLDMLDDILSGSMTTALVDEALKQINTSSNIVHRMAVGDKPVYGINTGFGPLWDTIIQGSDTHQLQRNLLITHAVGVGTPISPLLSKTMMITKVHALAQGHSGIRTEVIERIQLFIDRDWIPVVPSQGSVGASGDLAPLSHLFLPLIGEGFFWQGSVQVAAGKMLADHNLIPLELHSKEGLALINGTQFILAHAALGLKKMEYLLDLADVVAAMSLEGYQGSAAPFHPGLHKLRPFSGSQIVAERMLHFLKDSDNLHQHADCHRVQDPYSIRCVPQVHGASRNAISHLRELTEIELNAVTDNPIILNEQEIISGGNFHGQPLAMAIDYACLATAELGNISDRRCYLLLEGKYGLPRMLVHNEGLNSGLMIPQYTTAALVTENKTLCYPASADSIPTALGQEDHVSMGSISGRKWHQVINNLEKILAIELLYATQAMEFRRPNTFSDILEENFAIVRKEVSFMKEDRLIAPDIEALIQLVKNQKIYVKHDRSR